LATSEMPKVTPSLSSRFGRFINAPWVTASGKIDRQTQTIEVSVADAPSPPQASGPSNSTIISIRPQNSTSSTAGQRTVNLLEVSKERKAFVVPNIAVPWNNANMNVRRGDTGEAGQE
jgi:hypothetical protein